MDQKRLLIFSVSTVAIIFGWNFFVLPLLLPARKPQPLQNQAQKDPQEDKAAAVKKDPSLTAEKTPAAPDVIAEAAPKAEAPPAELAKFPHQAGLKIGSLDNGSPYRMLVTFDSQGAIVSGLELNDPRYRELPPSQAELNLLGNTPTSAATLQIAVPALDEELKRYQTSAAKVDWEVVPDSHTENAITFRYRAPSGKLEVLKRFELTQLDPQAADEAVAYDLKFRLTFRNLGAEPREVTYELQGPVGLPLENSDSTRKYRDVVAGFLNDDGTVSKNVLLSAKEITDEKAEDWRRPVRYIGVDVQYFAALLLPQGDQLKDPYFSATRGTLAGPNLKEKEKSDVSVTAQSVPLPLAAAGSKGDEVAHEFFLFAGPKREELLKDIGAQKIIDYGMSGNIGVPQAMLWLLDFFHGLFPSGAWPYGWSIILLTVVVRSAMFPISRKQALAAAKMQEIQPQIAELKKKYANEPEKMGRAQMELFRKHNYNPFGGCLLMFLQLPIFIGLYQALNISVDLRRATFLWIDNLAAPDALFHLPFRLPILGTEFNLLPIITIGLFIVQQKMFMPPPTDKEQELQQKMMSYMMIFMGFMFYHVPAGLCVYFIASSVWGLTERKLLPKAKPPTGPTGVLVGKVEPLGSTNGSGGNRSSDAWKKKQRR